MQKDSAFCLTLFHLIYNKSYIVSCFNVIKKFNDFVAFPGLEKANPDKHLKGERHFMTENEKLGFRNLKVLVLK